MNYPGAANNETEQAYVPTTARRERHRRGNDDQATLTLSDAPDGLAGYTLSVEVSDTAVATVDGVEYVDDPAVTDHPDAYDFNGSGDVEFNDVVTLFEEI